MLRINLSVCVYLCATTLLTATCILGQQQQLYRKPWPTYSLQNMPQTQFTCHDKILGGYYADAETQCQMFHVCVKVAGVGVQDFRFLCPNGTAFDQEAQICADWGDVDCEQSVLYYGSDNFDLYRIGSGFESKRAPLAEEDEATFHLQRAESADIRRSKETRVDQKARPDQPPNYTRQFEATPRNSYNNYANLNANNYEHQQQQQQKKKVDAVKKPIVNYYTPTTTTTTTTTTERYTDESKQDFDDIFKGSHSSHFFANRNGGREDDFVDHPQKSQKPNDFTDYSKKSETSTTGKATRPQPTRPKRIQTTSTTPATTTSTSTTSAPKTINKKVTLQTSFNSDFFEFSPLRAGTTQSSTTAATTTARPAFSNVNRFSYNSGNAAQDYQTQEKIQPTTYNPGSNAYRFKTTTPKYTELNRISSAGTSIKTTTKDGEYFSKTKSYNKPTTSSRKAQKLERTQQKLGPQNSSFVNHNEFSEFAKVKQQQPQPFQPAQVFRAPAPSPNNEPQYYRSRGSQKTPAPFTAPREEERIKTTISPELRPRGFSNRGSINYKATTQRSGELYTPTTSNVKKFSTLVPKEQYTPTTFKPTTYKKPYENVYYQQSQQTSRPTSKTVKYYSTSTEAALPTTANPYYNADEDDGQYHPELYEVDFPRNRLNVQRSSTNAPLPSTTLRAPITSSTTRKPQPFSYNNQNPQVHLKTQQLTAFQKQKEQATPVDLSDEEELFKTAHSLNFGAASINKLRADIFKAEKTSQQYNSQYSPKIETSSPTTSTTYASTASPSTIYTFPTYSPTTTTTTTTPAPSTTTFLTTRRPTAPSTTTTRATTTYRTIAPTLKSSKAPGGGSKKGKGKKKSKSASKRPPHADEDTSYDYAYYDSDTLSESPQEYSEYEIAEFSKTRKN